MKKIELENAIIGLDSVALLAKLISEANLTSDELQSGCNLLRELIEARIQDVKTAFYD